MDQFKCMYMSPVSFSCQKNCHSNSNLLCFHLLPFHGKFFHSLEFKREHKMWRTWLCLLFWELIIIKTWSIMLVLSKRQTTMKFFEWNLPKVVLLSNLQYVLQVHTPHQRKKRWCSKLVVYIQFEPHSSWNN